MIEHCQACGKPMPARKRSSQKSCSHKCRQMLYRHRRQVELAELRDLKRQTEQHQADRVAPSWCAR